MTQFKDLLRALMLFYQVTMLTIFICFLFITIPIWLSAFNVILSIIGLISVVVFNKAINILPDED